MAKSSIGDRGKWAEGEMKKFLTKMNSVRAEFAWHRLPDARSARGALAAQPCDFIAQTRIGTNLYSGPMFYMIESKEVKHDFRLPYDKVSQLAILHKWNQAGAEGVIAVYFSTIDKWRLAFVDELVAAKKEGTASWDLRDWETYATVEDAFLARKVFG